MLVECSVVYTRIYLKNNHHSNHSSCTVQEWYSMGIIIRPGTRHFSTKNNRHSVIPSMSSKKGEIHGIEFFKSCMNALQMNAYPFHIMFMPCSDEFKYAQRFKRLNWYICTHCPNLTSGLYDVDVFEPRECLHEAIGHENRILERNYRILGDIKGKEAIIVDDVLTTGQSMSDYKREIERCGGKVVAVIFYGKTITMPHPLIVKLEVWGDYITCFSKSN